VNPVEVINGLAMAAMRLPRSPAGLLFARMRSMHAYQVRRIGRPGPRHFVDEAMVAEIAAGFGDTYRPDPAPAPRSPTARSGCSTGRCAR
jgi:hypothetical protein